MTRPPSDTTEVLIPAFAGIVIYAWAVIEIVKGRSYHPLGALKLATWMMIGGFTLTGALAWDRAYAERMRQREALKPEPH